MLNIAYVRVRSILKKGTKTKTFWFSYVENEVVYGRPVRYCHSENKNEWREKERWDRRWTRYEITRYILFLLCIIKPIKLNDLKHTISLTTFYYVKDILTVNFCLNKYKYIIKRIKPTEYLTYCPRCLGSFLNRQ